MGAALAHLGWSPAQFWAATMHEFMAAQEAVKDANDAAAAARGQTAHAK